MALSDEEGAAATNEQVTAAALNPIRETSGGASIRRAHLAWALRVSARVACEALKFESDVE